MALELRPGGPTNRNGKRTADTPPPLGRVELTITIGTTTIQAKVLVLEMRWINLLLGNDVLRRFKKLEIEYRTGKSKMRFGERTVQMANIDQIQTSATKIVAKSGARIQARSMAAVEIEQTEATKPSLVGSPWMIEPSTNRTTGPRPGRALMPGDRPTDTEPKGIGTEIDATGRATQPLRTLNTELEKGITNSRDFTPSINQKIEDTLRDNIDCFAREGERLGRCNVAEDEIQITPNAIPIYETQRPASWKPSTEN
ncbi:hypothetical protein OUZ56_026088 [Daphnia magna]|uniref:Uncharacterized protein n=1 Tax=Daphnia magna TaxID=35525 RepID=A0ABQ9ZKQ8_9CRUS|nr:hypothetical protein OUZ56_026088 [Daphnia magna]